MSDGHFNLNLKLREDHKVLKFEILHKVQGHYEKNYKSKIPQFWKVDFRVANCPSDMSVRHKKIKAPSTQFSGTEMRVWNFKLFHCFDKMQVSKNSKNWDSTSIFEIAVHDFPKKLNFHFSIVSVRHEKHFEKNRNYSFRTHCKLMFSLKYSLWRNYSLIYMSQDLQDRF